MTGCFDNSVGDAEGSQDSDSNSDPSTGESNGAGSSATSSNVEQSRTWFSSGVVYNQYWNDGQEHYSGHQRCLDWGPVYNSSTGEYMGEDCRDFGYPETESDWDTSNCTERGGEIVWTDYGYRNAPSCELSFASITTSPGEALLIYQMSGFTMESMCEGVLVYTSSYLASGAEYAIAPGSALDCTHELYKITTYSRTDTSTTNNSASWDNSDRQGIWSIVYAIQDTTVI